MPNPNVDEFDDLYEVADEADFNLLIRRLRDKEVREVLSPGERVLLKLHDASSKGPRGVMDLESAGLVLLPKEIGVFRSLIELRLGGNNLSSLPSSIAKLTRLRRLHLDNNSFTQLPLEVCSLKNLERLLVQNNQLHELPPEIGRLANLRTLNISNNRVPTLPTSATQLTSLTDLRLGGNRIPIPPEISVRSPLDIISFVLQVTSDGARTINEAKVLFVGEGGVGKTSLVKRMIDDSFDEYEPKTEGILIKNWHVDVYDHWIRMNIWDFGGQEIMHATHQFFLTERSLYVIVWDARQEDDYGQLEYWLNMVQSFGNNAPVIIVLNKTDIGSAEIDRRGLKRKYPLIRGFVNCSCKTGNGIGELKEQMCWQVHQLPHTTTTWPARWFTVKSQLESANKDFISLSEYESLCSHAKILEESDRQNLLQFLHDLGIVLSFHKDARLCDTNVLNPEWATGGVYKILNEEKFFGRGVFEIEALSRILSTARYPRDKHSFIINIMQKFELCYPIDERNQARFLIPDLLTKQQPFFKWDYRYSLAFQYHYNFLPSSVMSRFIVRMHSFIDKELVWRSGVILRDGKNRALVVSDVTAKRTFIYVDGPQNARRDLLAKIRINFEHIHRTISKIEAIAKVPLSEDHNIVVDYQHLLNLEAIGEQEFIPEGLKRKIKVWEMLYGVESRETRAILQSGGEQLKDNSPQHVVAITNTVYASGETNMSIDRRNTIRAGRDISIAQSQVMLEEVKGGVSQQIEQVSNSQLEVKKALEELMRLIGEDPILDDGEKAAALSKLGLLAQIAGKVVRSTEDVVEDTVRTIKGVIVEGSTHLFESGKELLVQIYNHLVR
jgi:internalin A